MITVITVIIVMGRSTTRAAATHPTPPDGTYLSVARCRHGRHPAFQCTPLPRMLRPLGLHYSLVANQLLLQT